MKVQPFRFENVGQLCEASAQLGMELPYQADSKVLGTPIKIGDKTVKNRILIQPIEGFDSNADGSPSERSVARYCEMARNGAGAIWIESVSVNEEGRSNGAQLWITRENVGSFEKMNQAIQQAGDGDVYTILQLTHSGRYSNPHGTPRPVCAFHSESIPKENERIITDEELEALEEDYVEAILLAQQAGFDAVDVRACHGYLINELFAAVNRPGRYGGSFENRVRMLLNIIDKAKSRCSIVIGVRLNMYDGVPYPDGWGVDHEDPTKMDLEEPLKLVRLLNARGVRLLNVSNGIGAYSPFVIRPYDTGGLEPFEPQLAGINRMLTCARLAKQNAPDMIVVGSALTWLREFGPGVAAAAIEKGWYDIAGFGRQALAYPEFSRDILSGDGMRRSRCCVTCCGCTNMIKKQGKMLRCVMREKLSKN